MIAAHPGHPIATLATRFKVLAQSPLVKVTILKQPDELMVSWDASEDRGEAYRRTRNAVMFLAVEHEILQQEGVCQFFLRLWRRV